MVKTEFGNFGGIFGNSDSEDGVGKKISVEGLTDFETDAEPEQFSKFPRLQTKYVKRQQTKPINRGEKNNVLNFIPIQITISP